MLLQHLPTSVVLELGQEISGEVQWQLKML